MEMGCKMGTRARARKRVRKRVGESMLYHGHEVILQIAAHIRQVMLDFDACLL